MFNDTICSNPPATTATDAGVAGAGVLLSFIITAFLSLLISSVIILHEARRKSEAKILRKLLLSFSDQQVITGIGIQSIALAKIDTMVPYHFFLVWMMGLLSSATHIGTLLALVGDFKRDWVLRWLRMFFMFVNLVLSVFCGIFVLESVLKNMAATLPIACVWTLPSNKPPSDAAISIAGTVAAMAGQAIFFCVGVWYLHVKEKKWLKIFQMAGLLVLIAMGAGAAIKVILLSQSFGTPSVAFNPGDDGEKTWSFGQLLPLLLLLLPLVSAVEIFRGEMKVPAPVVDDHIPLIGLEDKDKKGVAAAFVSRFSKY